VDRDPTLSNQPTTEIMVRGLDVTVDEAALKSSVLAIVPECHIVALFLGRDRLTREPVGFGIITYATTRDAQWAHDALQRLSIFDVPVRVMYVRRANSSTKDPIVPPSSSAAPQHNKASDDFSAVLALCNDVQQGTAPDIRSPTKDADKEVREMLQGYLGRWGTLRDDQKEFFKAQHERYLPGSVVPADLSADGILADIDAFAKSFDVPEDMDEGAVPHIEVVVSSILPTTIPKVPAPMATLAPQPPAPAPAPSLNALQGAQRMKQMLEEQKRKLSQQPIVDNAVRIAMGVAPMRQKAKFTDED
jgi:hypothetical protein